MIRPAESQDGESVQALAAQAGNFDQEEVACVGELWLEFMQKGADASGYYFLVDEIEQTIAGFACYGPRPLTYGAYDLYWIAVNPQFRRRGIGAALLEAVAVEIKKLGGRLMLAETSGSAGYAGTRQFYRDAGFKAEAMVKDFYQDGDDLVMFTRRV
jgi:ribosomal protein S18 acetylase RimI-like enzyme